MGETPHWLITPIPNKILNARNAFELLRAGPISGTSPYTFDQVVLGNNVINSLSQLGRQNRRFAKNHPPRGSNPRPIGPCALPTELGGLDICDNLDNQARRPDNRWLTSSDASTPKERAPM